MLILYIEAGITSLLFLGQPCCIYIYIRMYVCMYVCMYVYIYIYIYIYINHIPPKNLNSYDSYSLGRTVPTTML